MGEKMKKKSKSIKMEYNGSLEIFWRRVASLHKAYEKAKNKDMKNVWKQKMMELMRKLQKVDKKELN